MLSNTTIYNTNILFLFFPPLIAYTPLQVYVQHDAKQRQTQTRIDKPICIPTITSPAITSFRIDSGIFCCCKTNLVISRKSVSFVSFPISPLDFFSTSPSGRNPILFRPLRPPSGFSSARTMRDVAKIKTSINTRENRTSCPIFQLLCMYDRRLLSPNNSCYLKARIWVGIHRIDYPRKQVIIASINC